MPFKKILAKPQESNDRLYRFTKKWLLDSKPGAYDDPADKLWSKDASSDDLNSASETRARKGEAEILKQGSSASGAIAGGVRKPLSPIMPYAAEGESLERWRARVVDWSYDLAQRLEDISEEKKTWRDRLHHAGVIAKQLGLGFSLTALIWRDLIKMNAEFSSTKKTVTLFDSFTPLFKVRQWHGRVKKLFTLDGYAERAMYDLEMYQSELEHLPQEESDLPEGNAKLIKLQAIMIAVGVFLLTPVLMTALTIRAPSLSRRYFALLSCKVKETAKLIESGKISGFLDTQKPIRFKKIKDSLSHPVLEPLEFGSEEGAKKTIDQSQTLFDFSDQDVLMLGLVKLSRYVNLLDGHTLPAMSSALRLVPWNVKENGEFVVKSAGFIPDREYGWCMGPHRHIWFNGQATIEKLSHQLIQTRGHALRNVLSKQVSKTMVKADDRVQRQWESYLKDHLEVPSKTEKQVLEDVHSKEIFKAVSPEVLWAYLSQERESLKQNPVPIESEPNKDFLNSSSLCCVDEDKRQELLLMHQDVKMWQVNLDVMMTLAYPERAFLSSISSIKSIFGPKEGESEPFTKMLKSREKMWISEMWSLTAQSLMLKNVQEVLDDEQQYGSGKRISDQNDFRHHSATLTLNAFEKTADQMLKLQKSIEMPLEQEVFFDQINSSVRQWVSNYTIKNEGSFQLTFFEWESLSNQQKKEKLEGCFARFEADELNSYLTIEATKKKEASKTAGLLADLSTQEEVVIKSEGHEETEEQMALRELASLKAPESLSEPKKRTTSLRI